MTNLNENDLEAADDAKTAFIDGVSHASKESADLLTAERANLLTEESSE